MLGGLPLQTTGIRGNKHRMKLPKKSPSLSVMSSLKTEFKTRCSKHAVPMAVVVAGLIDGWLLGRYTISLPPDPRPQNIYVPPGAWQKLRDACGPGAHDVPRRAVLEGLITGWLEGRFQLPEGDDQP